MPASLSDFIIRLADNKYALGRRFSEWTNRAPTLEAAVAAAAMSQDEVGHARSLYATLHSLPDSPEAYLLDAPEKRDHPLNLPALDKPFDGWAEFVAASVLFDRALTLVFEVARDSSYKPLRQRAAKILQEERFHRIYGQGWLKRWAAAGPKARVVMQAALNRLWKPTADWLNSIDNGDFVAEGILSESAESLRARWAAEIKPLLADYGLAVNHEQ